MLRTPCLAAIVSFCLAFSIAIPAMAQEDISDAELEKAAKAYVDIAMINQDFQEAVQDTSGQDERQELQREAQESMVVAVKNAGLDVESYNVIIDEVSKNEEMAEKFRLKIKQMQ